MASPGAITSTASRPPFITFEGGEGAGKSTQARLLAAWLEAGGIAVDLSREPGGTEAAEEIRALLVSGAPGRWDTLAETLLHYAARREHMERRLKPALTAGRWVISDRFADSTLAYQGYGQGVDRAAIEAISAAVLGDFVPDLTLVLDVAPETRRARLAARGEPDDRYERMDEAFHARVREGFRAIAAAEPRRCVLIPADGPAEAVEFLIRNAVANRLPLPPSPAFGQAERPK